MTRTIWPNLLSGVRIALAPAAVIAAAVGTQRGFLILFGAMLVTDALDGFLARTLNAQSELGRRLDSLGDYLTVAAGAVGLLLLWPATVRREWVWFAVGIAGYFAVIVYGLVRWQRVPGYHSWASKTVAVMFAVALVPLLAGWAAWPFRVVMVLQVLTGLEELAIALVLPGSSGEVASLWHALQRRRVGQPVKRANEAEVAIR